MITLSSIIYIYIYNIFLIICKGKGWLNPFSWALDRPWGETIRFAPAPTVSGTLAVPKNARKIKQAGDVRILYLLLLQFTEFLFHHFLIFSPPKPPSTRSFMIQICVGWFNHQIGETQLVGGGYSWRLGNLVTVAQLPWRAMEMEMAMAAVWGEPRKVAGIFFFEKWVKGKSRFGVWVTECTALLQFILFVIQVSGQQRVQVFFLCVRLELQVCKHNFQYSWIIFVICIAFEEQWKHFLSQVLRYTKHGRGVHPSFGMEPIADIFGIKEYTRSEDHRSIRSPTKMWEVIVELSLVSFLACFLEGCQPLTHGGVAWVDGGGEREPCIFSCGGRGQKGIWSFQMHLCCWVLPSVLGGRASAFHKRGVLQRLFLCRALGHAEPIHCAGRTH